MGKGKKEGAKIATNPYHFPENNKYGGNHQGKIPKMVPGQRH